MLVCVCFATVQCMRDSGDGVSGVSSRSDKTESLRRDPHHKRPRQSVLNHEDREVDDASPPAPTSAGSASDVPAIVAPANQGEVVALLVRHGKSYKNAFNKAQKVGDWVRSKFVPGGTGSSKDAPLIDSGFQDALYIYKALAAAKNSVACAAPISDHALPADRTNQGNWGKCYLQQAAAHLQAKVIKATPGPFDYINNLDKDNTFGLTDAAGTRYFLAHIATISHPSLLCAVMYVTRVGQFEMETSCGQTPRQRWDVESSPHSRHIFRRPRSPPRRRPRCSGDLGSAGIR